MSVRSDGSARTSAAPPAGRGSEGDGGAGGGRLQAAAVRGRGGSGSGNDGQGGTPAARPPFRMLPAPLLSAVLFVTWLLLNQSLSLGQIALAALLAIVLPWFTEPLRPERPRLRRAGVLLRLLGVVLVDIVKSNIEVARRILGPESAIKPRFVWVPLSIRDPHGIASLAGIITMTPGTLSADLTADRRWLLVHAFNVDDEAALVQDIKSRYEAPLMRIFNDEGRA